MKLTDITSYLLMIIGFGLSLAAWSYTGVFDPVYTYVSSKEMLFKEYDNYATWVFLLLASLLIFKIIKRKMKPLFIKGLVDRELSGWKKNKKFYTISLLKMFIVIWVCTPFVCVFLYFTYFSQVLFEPNFFLPIKPELNDFYNQILLTAAGVEGALVGIIIPVIFALVEQLFRDQDTHFKAFLYWSKVIWLIISSLAFLGFVFLQLSLSPDRTYITFYLTLAWLILNIVGTAYLIIISIKFFFSGTRYALIKKYIGHVLLLNEIENNLSTAIRQRAEQ